MTMVDRASREVKLVPMHDKGANQVAEAIFSWILEKGPPKKIFSDGDPAYLSSLVRELLKLCNTNLIVFSPYSHRNGLADSMNAKAESILRATIAADETAKLRWPKLLTVVEHVLNFSPQTAS